LREIRSKVKRKDISILPGIYNWASIPGETLILGISGFNSKSLAYVLRREKIFLPGFLKNSIDFWSKLR
jgi:hypothetical protein